MNINDVLLRRKNAILVPTSDGKTRDSLIATFNVNIQSLGYTLSAPLIRALQNTGDVAVTRLLGEVLESLKQIKGVRSYRPMYPNFPQQVMEMAEVELYLNAIVHYWSFVVVDITGNSDNIWLPRYDKEKRTLLDEKTEVRVITQITKPSVEALATAIATSNTSISPSDKEDLALLHQSGYLTFPEKIPNKENLAFVGALFIHDASLDLFSHFKTATDVLRLATALSKGDVSLAENTKFRNFSRAERRVILALLEKCGSTLAEDMQRWRKRWLRLGERLHPFEHKMKFPRTAVAFDLLWADTVTTTNSLIEAAVRKPDVREAIKLLSRRPGDFARRMDHVLRQTGTRAMQNSVIRSFDTVAHEVSTPVLLQAMTHFKHRNDMRVVMPKGNLAQVMSIPDLPALPQSLSDKMVDNIADVLVRRFSKLPKLGKTYIDPNLRTCLVPFSQRSASKSLRPLVRGSKLSFGNEKNTLRFFVWWHEINGDRTDIDLSAVLVDEKFKTLSSISYLDLRAPWGVHSGDITSAPNGASEFIDIDIPKAIRAGGRYVFMSLGGYTPHNFCDLKECVTGWMLREKPQSGEIYDPRTVVDRSDVTIAAKAGTPLLVDLQERQVIWADVAYDIRSAPNNVRNNRGTIELVGHALVNLHKPNLFDLFSLHVEARGKLVTTPAKAQTVFSVAAGTPFELEKIASEFMQDAVKTPLKKGRTVKTTKAKTVAKKVKAKSKKAVAARR